MLHRDLAVDLVSSKKIRSDDAYAQRVYAAMCNMLWQHPDNDGEPWAITWRTAGWVVASIRGDESLFAYMQFYCSGNEGEVSPDVASDLAALGWTSEPYEDLL